MPGQSEHVEVHRYAIRTSEQLMDMEASNNGTFEGVYTETRDGIIMTWDTIGSGRPLDVDEPPRFGLNRMELKRNSNLKEYNRL